MRELRRSTRARRLLDELTAMADAADAALQQAIAAISQSDPLIKLLNQVSLGRMKPHDAGLRAVTESWLKTYRQVIETTALSRPRLARLNPAPRIDVLVEAGVLDTSNEAAVALRRSFEQLWARAQPS